MGGAGGILSSYISDEIKQSANPEDMFDFALMCAEAAETKSPTDLSLDDILNGVRGAPVADNIKDTGNQDQVQKILNQFVVARELIRTDESKYNLAHDYLAPYVNIATEGIETSVEHANKLLKRYAAEYGEDTKVRIPFRHIMTITRFASPNLKRQGKNTRSSHKK